MASRILLLQASNYNTIYNYHHFVHTVPISPILQTLYTQYTIKTLLHIRIAEDDLVIFRKRFRRVFDRRPGVCVRLGLCFPVCDLLTTLMDVPQTSRRSQACYPDRHRPFLSAFLSYLLSALPLPEITGRKRNCTAPFLPCNPLFP